MTNLLSKSIRLDPPRNENKDKENTNIKYESIQFDLFIRFSFSHSYLITRNEFGKIYKLLFQYQLILSNIIHKIKKVNH